MIPRLAVACLLVTTVCAEAQGQDGGRVTFDTIIKSLDAHKKMYRTNKRYVVLIKSFQIEAKSGQYSATPVDDQDTEIVLDAAGNRRSTVTASRNKPERLNVGFYTTPEIIYMVKREGNQYFVDSFIARNSNLSEFVRSTTIGAESMPSNFDGRSIESISLHLKDNSRMTHLVSVGTPTRTTKFGREVVSVPSDLKPRAELGGRAGGPIRQTSYFDPSNSLVYLGSESSYVSTSSRTWAHRVTCTLEYTARDGTYPVPKRFTRYVQPEKGEKLLEMEIEYKSVEDYTPDPEEFRLEKRYGLTTPAGPDGKALVGVRSSRSRLWLWVSILVGTVLVGVLGLYLYRRRQRRPAAPPKES